MNRLPCGCFVNGAAIAYCPQHSETNNPPGFSADQSRAEQAPRKKPATPPAVEPVDETLPALQGKRRRQRWNPVTGICEDIEENTP